MTTPTAAAGVIERDWPIDVGQLKSLIEDLRFNDERTLYALAASRTGIWEAELVTGHMEWSETMPLVMGCTAADCGGTLDGLRDRLHADDRDRLSRVIHGNFEGHRDFQIDVRVPWPDGTVRWVQLRGRVRPVDGTSIQLLGVAHDITEYKELELRLRQSQKLEAMGRLAGGVAHDFNNILTAILGYAVLIEGDPIDEVETRSHAVQITKAAHRAAMLSRQLLAFSRRQVVERRAVCVGDIVADLLPMMAKILGEQIRVEREFASDLGAVFADPGQLEQVVLNLAINARDAMPEGGVLRIAAANITLGVAEVCSRLKLTGGDYVLVTVTDSGTGMDAGTRDRIFEPFFTTKDADHGTGLGLSTVFGIVKSLGGGIRVSSAPGEGTTFKIYLPRIEAAAASDPEPPATAHPAGGSEMVLVVEDEDAVRNLAAEILQRNGYTVVTAPEAGTARRLALESPVPIDLVVTDVMMPDGTGPELLAELSVLHAKPRALYMSGYAGAVLARQGRLVAGSAFLQKPFTGQQLLASVRQVLDAPAAPGPAAALPNTTDR